jgi:aspartate aminotransferase-like enzyme
MPDEVLRAMHRPALDIYSEQMFDMTDSLLRDLATLFATKGRTYIYIANGHGAWEAVLSNVLSRGDEVLVLESGRFAVGWGNAAAAMGAKVEVLKGDWRRAIRPTDVGARLPHRAPSTTSKPSARRSRRPVIRRCSWSTRWLRSAACRSRWTRGASTWRCPARKKA